MLSWALELPPDLIREVLSFASLWDIALLDSAICSQQYRTRVFLPLLVGLRCKVPLLQKTVVVFRGAGGAHSANCFSVLSWVRARRLTIEELSTSVDILATFPQSSSTPRDTASSSIDVVSLLVQYSSWNATSLNFTQDMWERMWKSIRAEKMELKVSDLSFFDSLFWVALPTEQLFGLHVTCNTQSPILLAPHVNRLKTITASMSTFPLQSLLDVLDSCRDTLENLNLHQTGSPLPHNWLQTAQVQTSTRTWPKLENLEILVNSNPQEDIEPLNQLIRVCFERATSLRYLYTSVDCLTTSSTGALLQHQIWKPREHELIWEINRMFQFHPSVDWDYLQRSMSSWVSSNPPITNWYIDHGGDFDSQFAPFIPLLPQQHQRALKFELSDDGRAEELPMELSASWFSIVLKVAVPIHYISQWHHDIWCSIWKSASLKHIYLWSPLHMLGHDVWETALNALEEVALQKSQEDCVMPTALSYVDLSFVDINATHRRSSTLLQSLCTCYGHTLTRVDIGEARLSNVDVLRFLVHCPLVAKLDLGYVDTFTSELSPALVESRRKTKGPCAFQLELRVAVNSSTWNQDVAFQSIEQIVLLWNSTREAKCRVVLRVIIEFDLEDEGKRALLSWRSLLRSLQDVKLFCTMKTEMNPV